MDWVNGAADVLAPAESAGDWLRFGVTKPEYDRRYAEARAAGFPSDVERLASEGNDPEAVRQRFFAQKLATEQAGRGHLGGLPALGAPLFNALALGDVATDPKTSRATKLAGTLGRKAAGGAAFNFLSGLGLGRD